MTAMLTDNLPLLAGSPNGIQKVRELILELAVSGKLVPRDASDEPASELLKRIAAEKTRLVAEGKLKKQKEIADISGSEKPFALPVGWTWAFWDTIALKIGDIDHKMPDTTSEGIPFVSPRDFYPGNVINFEGAKRVSVEDFERLSAKIKAERGDLIYPRYGTIGENILVEVERDFLVSYSCAVIKVAHGFIDPIYQFYVSMSGCIRKQAKAAENKTTQANVGIKSIQQYLFPIPPLAEQHRIVAKVDELMALCDRLEARQADAESAHIRLVQALLDSLTQANDAAGFAANWQRLAEHFHTLFTTESSIDALKQTLLQLAVMGKLVPQYPGDEHSSELLKRIAEEKGRMLEGGKIRRQKLLGAVSTDEKLYEIPSTWAWTRLGSQVLESGAGWSPSCESRPRNEDEWGVLKVSAVSWGVYKPEENKALPSHLEARLEHEVTDGDFLVSRANTAELVARSVVVEETPKRLMLSDKIVRLKLTSLCARRYLNLANRAPLARRYYGRVAGGTSSSMKNVSREQILSLPIALPPLAEQNRIVAKVDQLMTICDQLKTRLTQARQINEQLASTLVEQAVV
jgi:type I restriction enzyme S subunit